MKRLLNWLSRKRFPYEPLITVTISKGRLLHNLNQFRTLMPKGVVAPVLKSNAYGHGLFEVARILEREPGIPFFVVDSYFEAVALRARGIKKPLLIIGYTRPRTIAESGLKNVSFTVSNLETLEALKDITNEIRIHLKLDTGFRRQGLLPNDVPRAMEILKNDRWIYLEGICTHFADADNDDESFTEHQIGLWNKQFAEFRHEFPSMIFAHAANTDGSRFSPDIKGNVMRLGLGLYGLTSNPKLLSTLDLKPVLEVKTIITGLKMLLKGESVGYSRTFTAPRDMCIATIPFGYYEGLDRRLSNNGSVQVGDDDSPNRHGQKVECPLIGRISMNISTIDVSAVPGECHLKMGMPVTVISRERGDPNSIAALARHCGTIEYEGVVRIPPHLKRVVVD